MAKLRKLTRDKKTQLKKVCVAANAKNQRMASGFSLNCWYKIMCFLSPDQIVVAQCVSKVLKLAADVPSLWFGNDSIWSLRLVEKYRSGNGVVVQSRWNQQTAVVFGRFRLFDEDDERNGLSTGQVKAYFTHPYLYLKRFDSVVLVLDRQIFHVQQSNCKIPNRKHLDSLYARG
jgi:hypothetical protein